jgi:hypothetical protein
VSFTVKGFATKLFGEEEVIECSCSSLGNEREKQSSLKSAEANPKGMRKSFISKELVFLKEATEVLLYYSFRVSRTM